ncbi:MAG: hypothetical protein AB1393_08580 [Candidatus Edwardsbacteria bacterium]
MTWMQILAQGAIIATFFAFGIALAAYFNGKHIKAGVSEIAKIIERLERGIEGIERGIEEIGKGIEGIGKMIEEMRKDTAEMLLKMDERAEERHREVVELIAKIKTG